MTQSMKATERLREDWSVNGHRPDSDQTAEIWDKLDWSRAWSDPGPSPAGNPGPYWHVPWDFDGEELWARLYPLNSKASP